MLNVVCFLSFSESNKVSMIFCSLSLSLFSSLPRVLVKAQTMAVASGLAAMVGCHSCSFNSSVGVRVCVCVGRWVAAGVLVAQRCFVSKCHLRVCVQLVLFLPPVLTHTHSHHYSPSCCETSSVHVSRSAGSWRPHAVDRDWILRE